MPPATSGYRLAILRIARGWQQRQVLGGGLSFSARADSSAARGRSSSALRTTGPVWGCAGAARRAAIIQPSNALGIEVPIPPSPERAAELACSQVCAWVGFIE